MLDIRKWIRDVADYSYQSLSSSANVAGAGVGYISKWIGGLQLFGSTKTVSTGKNTHDERHYFLVPDPRSEDGYSIVVTRCLPEGVPPINDLPKLRVVHLPSIDSEAMLRALLVKQAQAESLSVQSEGKSLSDRARDLANQLDIVDEKVFGGVLLIGGLVAIFNPIAGAAIAAKALIPSVGILLSKYGLRVAEENLSQAEVNQKLKNAEKEVLSQFRNSKTEEQIDPVLAILAKAIETDEQQYDPLLALHECLNDERSELEKYSHSLSVSAILTVYDTVLKSKSPSSVHPKIGPEDIRFLKVLKDIEQSNEK